MRQIVQRALLIVIGGAALGLAANLVSPKRIPFITPPKAALNPGEIVPLPQAKELWGTGAAFFLDARAPADYSAGHISGAFSLPAEGFDDHYAPVAAMLTPESSIVCYCDGMECDLSKRVSELLRQRGFTNVHILVNGWTSWHGAGYPTTMGAQP
jgi:rhodanese-related sulfurtransferase